MKILVLLSFIWLGGPGTGTSDMKVELQAKYERLHGERPSMDVFSQALRGYEKIEGSSALDTGRSLLTIIDMNLPSNKKRLWVIDLKRDVILFHTYAAHGKNSGELFAERFSNIPGSHQSSLGFYITGDTYTGKNGYSLYLDGLERDCNDLARERAIVMHGAWYATDDFIRKHGRLGRSFGCPAVPPEVHEELIDTISGGTILYIHADDEKYALSSRLK